MLWNTSHSEKKKKRINECNTMFYRCKCDQIKINKRFHALLTLCKHKYLLIHYDRSGKTATIYFLTSDFRMKTHVVVESNSLNVFSTYTHARVRARTQTDKHTHTYTLRLCFLCRYYSNNSARDDEKEEQENEDEGGEGGGEEERGGGGDEGEEEEDKEEEDGEDDRGEHEGEGEEEEEE